MNLTKIDDSCVVHFCCISIGRSGLGVRKQGKEKKRNQSTGHDCVPRSTGDAEDVPLTNSSWGRRRGAWQVQLGWRTKSGPWASKQTQPLSKARPELRSPAHSLLLPLDGERRWPSFSAPLASLLERWCVFLWAWPHTHTKTIQYNTGEIVRSTKEEGVVDVEAEVDGRVAR